MKRVKIKILPNTAGAVLCEKVLGVRVMRPVEIEIRQKEGRRIWKIAG